MHGFILAQLLDLRSSLWLTHCETDRNFLATLNKNHSYSDVEWCYEEAIGSSNKRNVKALVKM